MPLNGGNKCQGSGSQLGMCGEKCDTKNTNYWSCCTPSNPCYEDEGDCDSDADCIGKLVCGSRNCVKRLNHHASADCCTKASNRCASGWSLYARNQMCYRRFTNPLAWTQAYVACKKVIPRANLVSVPDSGTNNFITSLTPTSRSPTWIGAYRSGNVFKWIGGKPMTYTHWYPGEPNNHGGSQDRIMTYGQWYGGKNENGKWDDAGRNDKAAYMCEYSPRV